MLEREYDWYKEHHAELAAAYLGKFIVVIGEQVVGSYDTMQDAYAESVKEHEVGTFLIQEIVADPATLRKRFYSGLEVEA
jgi:hypothetical protein